MKISIGNLTDSLDQTTLKHKSNSQRSRWRDSVRVQKHGQITQAFIRTLVVTQKAHDDNFEILVECHRLIVHYTEPYHRLYHRKFCEHLTDGTVAPENHREFLIGSTPMHELGQDLVGTIAKTPPDEILARIRAFVYLDNFTVKNLLRCIAEAWGIEDGRDFCRLYDNAADLVHLEQSVSITLAMSEVFTRIWIADFPFWKPTP